MRANDKSGRPPRVELHQSIWGMIGLPRGGPEWSIEEKFDRIAAAGFTGVLDFMPDPAKESAYRKLLDRHRFQFAIHSFPCKPSDIATLARRAKEFGALYVNSQVMDAFVIDQAAIDLLRGLHSTCADIGIPIFFETHRGRVTQDLLRTVSYARAIPDLRLTIDLSHYIVAGEIGEPNEAVEAAFDVLLARTSCIHGRVSNGQQVQSEVKRGPTGMFLKWWRKGVAAWREGARPGDVLPFVVELGPPGYAMTDSSGAEITDRWADALELKKQVEASISSLPAPC